MKKCPFCGAEYPDEIERCPVDNELPPTAVPEKSIEPSPLAAAPPPAPAETTPLRPFDGWTDRQVRIFELVLVCLVSFGSSILVSGYSLYYGGYSSGGGNFSFINHILKQVSCLMLLWYVLVRRGRTLSDLGFSWSWGDFGWSIPLRIGESLAFKAVYAVLYQTGLTAISHHDSSVHVQHMLFGTEVTEAAVLFQFVNPFFEELIVRAYVMTEVKFLTGSAAKAVLVSTVLQTSYHFYQGVPAALAHGAGFLLWAIYYAKTNRIAPVILAHLYADVMGTLWYGWRLP